MPAKASPVFSSCGSSTAYHRCGFSCRLCYRPCTIHRFCTVRHGCYRPCAVHHSCPIPPLLLPCAVHRRSPIPPLRRPPNTAA